MAPKVTELRVGTCFRYVHKGGPDHLELGYGYVIETRGNDRTLQVFNAFNPILDAIESGFWNKDKTEEFTPCPPDEVRRFLLTRKWHAEQQMETRDKYMKELDRAQWYLSMHDKRLKLFSGFFSSRTRKKAVRKRAMRCKAKKRKR